MKYLKKNLGWIVILVAIDQLIKLVIYKNCMQANVPLISDLVTFSPLRNTRLSWAGNFFALSRNPIFLYAVNLFGLALIPVLHNFFWKTMLKETVYSRIIYCAIMAGMICSFVDKLGGGSIDYIGLKNLFTFDLKDCYLTLWEISVFLYVVFHWNAIKRIKLRDIVRFYRKNKDDAEEKELNEEVMK